MKEILKYLEGTFNKKHPVERGIYVILKGTYSGEFFVYISQTSTFFTFISLPDKIIRQVPTDSFNNGLKNKLVEFLEQLPLNIYNTVEHEYNLINNNNGHGNPKDYNKPNKRTTGSPKNSHLRKGWKTS